MCTGLNLCSGAQSDSYMYSVHQQWMFASLSEGLRGWKDTVWVGTNVDRVS